MMYLIRFICLLRNRLIALAGIKESGISGEKNVSENV
jgi:hypothetical protein